MVEDGVDMMSITEARPPVHSPEFRPYFEMVVRTSKTRGEAVNRLGYATPTPIYHHLKRLGMQRPREWSRRPDVALARRRKIPDVVIPNIAGRRWVAGLVQGEGCIQCTYRWYRDATELDLYLSMVDRAPIDRLSDYYGLPRPSKPAKNHEWKRLWRKNIAGLRALRVLQEILPFLLGGKRREAERALQVFGPDGFHSGYIGIEDVWPRSEFPLRSKRRGTNPRTDSHVVSKE